MYEQIEAFVAMSAGMSLTTTFKVKRVDGTWYVTMMEGDEVMAERTGATLGAALTAMDEVCERENRNVAEENGAA